MKQFFLKKKFDQYFLKDKNIAKKIVKNLSFKNYNTVVELGPGLGILTRYLLTAPCNKNKVFLIEIDDKLIFSLKKKLSISNKNIIHKDFLKWNPEEIKLQNFALIGNFPYSISSKILFHILKYNQYIPECIGMFQKEVVERIISHKGEKNYGILSVLIQTFYDVKYLFTVKKHVFYPISNVKSAVISLKRKEVKTLCSKDILFQCVKMAFGQRRKILKNSLKPFKKGENFYNIPFLNKRAEQLSVKEFLQLAKEIEIIK
ncbi:MAG: 16S rRNA (adenine(1518)-N(6)/adenine(1519)-N(6))-dimethyltransferase RsmA [Flavobacteriales bacterium]|jgi:16S rRNA (adenine1518-N6/adenine1519-N6)-dimethyltransferase|uniref:16S rRNA (adenine(1518)-N(6)/adenine(1519)-N(6))- dimethyltransferase RsmA n=1 Tax=Blattabacterium sp. (Mastotermes darwiniensis) TaxID=39768 RepID=UPI000231DFCB|nr:16S rRNA (adenine(1518)-N(6)/adenine(1519)-N(6))-dimethyltransferase RsmA [Blattabacterium sp. (Mastotermes darwiniensis)]AER40483.1 16S rRNA dimethyladenosine transferase, SAM-dependent [Blattabacterium sp. (Mastotermes darwiniensis) str. MADAR]MDR1805002.1 16S rRNA (adenine(1518)-N(6)/adenine(1519)-N(6))-dimethyltransferase RsmA [Flavobacteriales bacterium]